MIDQDLWEQWRNPSAEYRGKPFWSWNGELNPDELIRQAGIFKEMGMGGYFLHSRTGLATPYLGDEWFRCINACADEGERLGMEAWLYDEDRWPSGSAGGLATREARHRMKYLRLSIIAQGEEAVWPDEAYFVAAFSAEVDGLDLGAYERIGYGDRAAAGRALLVFSWEEMTPHSFYNGETYLDTMSADATEHFLRITHDAYKEACGDRLGRSIKGIFTDEPHRGFVFCDSHGQPGVPDPGWATPWTPKLWDAFAQVFGYDLRVRLPELFLRSGGARLSPVKWAYMEVCQRLFLESWARPMLERCRKLGLVLTGHALHEDSLAAQAVPCGSMMRYYEFLDIPGVDILGLRNENFWVVKQLASVARQTGQRWLLSELYGCSGWQTNFEDHKRIGDWQALLGINLRCHHLSWYSMAGEAKRDYPASISFQSSWYREYAAVEIYFSRLHVLLQAGRPLCDVMVVNPVESLWAQIRPGWATWLGAVDEQVLELEAIYRQVFAWLCAAQVDFDYGDEEHLTRLGEVDAEGMLSLGKMRYRVVVVAGMETMRGSTLELLRCFREAGGEVIFAGPAPAYLDVVPSNQPARLAERCTVVGLEGEALGKAVRAASRAANEVELSGGGRGLFCQVRVEGEERIVVLLNSSETEGAAAVCVRSRGRGPVLELNCLTGEARAVKAVEEDGMLCWDTELQPLQERVFVCGAELPDVLSKLVPVTGERRLIEGPFEYELDEPNIAVLDRAEFSLNDGPWEPEREILRVEKIVCERLGLPLRGGQMVQPWVSRGREAVTAEGVSLRLRFGFSVKRMPAGTVRVLMEQPGHHRIVVNGCPVQVPVETEWLIDPCFRIVPLPEGVLREGRNELVLECAFRDGVDLEAVYLLGEFGVAAAEGRVELIELPSRLAVGDWTLQGLPFYSGVVALKMPAERARRLELEPMGVATLVARHPSGTPRRVLPWKPFACDLDGMADGNGMVVVEFVLTRRNTFGPLHFIPIEQPHIGPNHFRPEGDDYSPEYQLVPTGLKSAAVEGY